VDDLGLAALVVLQAAEVQVQVGLVDTAGSVEVALVDIVVIAAQVVTAV
jgi:hypothetical protein